MGRVLVMGWRYKVGLLLIGSVVVIWVASAEVTQVFACIHNPLTTTRRRRKMPFVCHWSLTVVSPVSNLWEAISYVCSKNGHLSCVPLALAPLFTVDLIFAIL